MTKRCVIERWKNVRESFIGKKVGSLQILSVFKAAGWNPNGLLVIAVRRAGILYTKISS
ncbi:MAG: hypothetical protein KBC53_07820 [Nitrosomonas sp.]|nr:hypothetical protein [Nitrosomonas sp.]